MKILFLGTLTSNKVRNYLDSFNARHEPGDIVQQYILKALKNVDNNDIYMINSPRIESYPDCKVKKVPYDVIDYLNIKGVSVGYNNYKLYSHLSRKNNFIRECKKWAFDNLNDPLSIFVFSLNSTFLQGALSIKRIIKNVNICVIVPDLPSFMSKYKWPLSFFKKIDVKRIEKLRKQIDLYVLYSSQMIDALKITNKNYIVIEGFIDKDKINIKGKKKFNSKKVCLYAGDLNKIYGIQMLINAFKNITIDTELHLYGSPKLICNYELNEKVKYMGLLNSKEVFEKMKEADLLINPRPSSLELTRYSFPSKTFEYMSSGTPSLMCKLPGIPEDYFEFLYFFEKENEDGYRDTIEKILEKSDDELSEKGKKAAEFLMNNKTSDIQVAKILERLKENEKKVQKGYDVHH